MMSFNTLDEAREHFVSLGFHEYKPSPIDNDSIATCFQKRYDDEIGKRWFLDVRI